jgi:hypothetical protein
MTAVWVRTWAEMRARWRSWAGLVVLLGLFGGAVIAISAGARRTDSAYTRFLAEQHAWDAGIPNFNFDPAFASLPFDRVERLPQVAESVRTKVFEATVNDGDGSIGSADPRFGTSFNRPKVLEGRLPAPGRADEAAAPFMLAKAWKLQVGSRITIPFIKAGSDPEHVQTLPVEFRIVGIEAAPGEFPPALGNQPVLFTSPAFVHAYESRIFTVDLLLVRLRHGAADLSAFAKGVNGTVPEGKVVFLFRQEDTSKNVLRSFHLQAIALWVLAALTGFVALLVFGQTLARQTFLESTDYPTLGALGMTRGQLTAVAVVRGAAAAAAGAIVASAVALAASPLFPTGLARVAEPHTGVAFDLTAVGIGVVAVLLVVSALQIFPAWRAARVSTMEPCTDAASGRHGLSVANLLARSGVPPTMSAGVRLALERGRGRTAVPVRTTILGITVAIAAFTAALTFGNNLNRLIDTPRLYGVNWDLQVGTTSFRSGDADKVLYPALRRDTRVAGIATVGISIPFQVGGRRVDAVALGSGGASVAPPILQGRLPERPDEVLLGMKTLQALHAHLGGTVLANVTGTRPRAFRVVGVGVIPPIGDVGRLGEGALVAYSSLSRFIPDAPPPDTLLIRLRLETDPASFVESLRKRFPATVGSIDRPQRPSDLVNFGRVQNMPLILAGLLAALAAGTLAHLLVTSIARRRRDFAILKTIGFSRMQVSTAVAWQATTIAATALLFGLPLGVAGGRWIWSGFAGQLGVVSTPAADVSLVLLIIPATILLANLIAVAPGRIAARLKPAPVLRAE